VGLLVVDAYGSAVTNVPVIDEPEGLNCLTVSLVIGIGQVCFVSQVGRLFSSDEEIVKVRG
jgi:hypothetical protein